MLKKFKKTTLSHPLPGFGPRPRLLISLPPKFEPRLHSDCLHMNLRQQIKFSTYRGVHEAVSKSLINCWGEGVALNRWDLIGGFYQRFSPQKKKKIKKIKKHKFGFTFSFLGRPALCWRPRNE